MAYEVTHEDTASAIGSGDVEVLATPRLIAWMEAATVEASASSLGAAQTSVGALIHVEHQHPTPVGSTVEVTAEQVGEPGGKRLSFQVRAVDQTGAVVAEGQIERAVVDRERFMKASLEPEERG